MKVKFIKLITSSTSFIRCLGFFLFLLALLVKIIFKLWEVVLLLKDIREFFLLFWLGLLFILFIWSLSFASFFSFADFLWCILISSIISSETSILIRWLIIILIVINLLPILLSLEFQIDLLNNLQFIRINSSTSGIFTTILSFLRFNEFIFSFHLGFEFIFELDFLGISDELVFSYSQLYLTPIDKTFSKFIYVFNRFFKIFWRYWCT